MKAFFAIVYELCLDGEHVAKDDPLYETSYIGQAGRYASSPEEVLEMRWGEHERGAKNDPKEYGLKWALKKYGPGAFTRRVICFLKFASRCIEALDYMNAVEIEEIDCRGGVMQEIDPAAPVWQTFNLTIGGQGNPTAKFASLQAKEERAWKRFQEKVLELVAETGTCRCQVDYTSNCGYGLGQTLSKIRSRRHFLLGVENAAERKKWLESIPGWSWKIRLNIDTDSWERFKRELLAHVEEFGTAHVKNKYVSASGYHLGVAVHGIRTRQQFLRGQNGSERRDWLNRLPGWVWKAKDSIEARQIRSAAASNCWKDDCMRKQRIERNLTTAKRKREEHWATLNEVELAEAKHKFELDQKRAPFKRAKRQAKARGEAPEPKRSPKPKTESRMRTEAKIANDLAALKATLVPKAQRYQLSRFRQDGTVAKAHQILRERSVDAGV